MRTGFRRGDLRLGARAILWGAVLLIAAATGAAASPLGFAVIMGSSMNPTLHNGQVCLMLKPAGHEEPWIRGDVVVFRVAGQTCVKRIAGLPGDTLYVVRNKEGFDDEIVMEWQFVKLSKALAGKYAAPTIWIEEVVVPEGSCYVLGDNLTASRDSRSFGAVPLSSICGKLVGENFQEESTFKPAGHFVSISTEDLETVGL